MALTAQQQLLVRVWKKAFAEGRVELTLPTRLLAQKVRWALYNLRPDSAELREDFEFKTARAECTISWETDTKIAVVRADKTRLYAELMEALGEQADEFISDEEREMRESEARIAAMGKVQVGAPTEAISDDVLARARNKFGARG